MTGRAVPEWIGRTPDSKVPPRVRQRIFERCNRTCYLSGIVIASGMRWELEHIKPLHLGGENRESNLAPALTEHHKIKTAAEMKAKAKADRIAKRASGSRPAPPKPIRSAGFRPTAKQKPERKPSLAPRALYRGAAE